MSMRTGNFAYLLAPGQRKVFFQTFEEMPTEYTAWMNIENSSRAYEVDMRMAGLQGVVQKPEGTPTQYVEAKQGEQKTYTHLSFGLGYRITFEMYQDDLYRVMNRMGRTLAKAVHNAIEVLGFGVLNHAFDSSPATAYAGFDGYQLCYASHTMLKAAAQANRPSSDVGFSMTAIRDACIRFENLYDEEGYPALLKPSRVIISPTNKWAAREIFGSGFKPGTANNEINALVDEDIKHMIVHYLTTSGAWFLMSTGGLQGGLGHDCNFFWRQKPIYESADDFDTGDAKFKVFFRASAGFGYPWGVDGSYA